MKRTARDLGNRRAKRARHLKQGAGSGDAQMSRPISLLDRRQKVEEALLAAAQVAELIQEENVQSETLTILIIARLERRSANA